MLRFDSIALLVAGLGMMALVITVAVIRRLAISNLARLLIGLGLLGLVLAMSGVSWRRPETRSVAVMVDLSPSTRTAAFRERGKLAVRIRQLLGNTPFNITYFGGLERTAMPGGTLADIPTQTTRLPPSSADGVLLFSDARFDLPATGPKTFIAIDPSLESPTDGAVERLELRGANAIVTVHNSGPPRELLLDGMMGSRSIQIPTGSLVIQQPIKPGASIVSATFTPGDAWPENDGASIHVPPPQEQQFWWIGNGPPTTVGWKSFSPANVPSETTAYLAPSIIVLQNISADELSSVQQQRLAQYVRELGGSLLILGGNHSFAAGGYPGSTLEELSPLASTPPQPATHWILLADGSGSMSEAAGPQNGTATRWDIVTSALTRLLPQLPPDDPVSLGSFSDVVRWWSIGRSGRDTSALPLPPAGVGPHGPTNLEQSLHQVADTTDAALPKQFLLLTDADAQLDDPASLIAAFKAKNIHLHLLAIGGETSGTVIPALQKIILATGGSMSRQPDPSRWLGSLQELMRGAMPRRWLTDPTDVQFLDALLTLPPRRVQPWNRTWLKPRATPFAQTIAQGERITMAARWHIGSGQVMAAAFQGNENEITAMNHAIARPPRDPRYSVEWTAGRSIQVRVDAVDPSGSINGLVLSFDLQLADGNGPRTTPVPQMGPGWYQLSLPAPVSPAFATLRGPGGEVIDRIAVAARYAPEFEAIGNDHAAMRELANRTGGELIAPNQTAPIDFHWPRRDVPMTSWLAICGAASIAAGLVVWRSR